MFVTNKGRSVATSMLMTYETYGMLDMICVGENFKMLVPASVNFVANILKLSPTVSHQHHDVTNMLVAPISWQIAVKIVENQKEISHYPS